MVTFGYLLLFFYAQTSRTRLVRFVDLQILLEVQMCHNGPLPVGLGLGMGCVGEYV